LAGGISKSYGNFGFLKFDRRTVGSASVYIGLVPGPTWVRPEFCLFRCIKKIEIFLLVAARAWVSFTRRTDALHPLKQNYGHFEPRGSREGKLFS
jgi:hypothetical protein